MAELPAGYPPDNNRGPTLLKIIWTFFGLSTITLSGRVITKLLKARRLYWDDALLILAGIFGLIYAIALTRAEGHGFGRHFIYLTPDQRENSLRIGVFTLAWGFLSPMAGRISFCVTMLYLTMADARAKSRWPIWFFIGLQAIVNLLTIVVFYTQCGRDLDIYWVAAKQHLAATQCLNPKVQSDLGYLQGSLNTLTDFFLTVWPAILIEHAPLTLKKKIGLALLLCLSLIALIASIVKTYYAKTLSETTDYTYDLSTYVIFICLELNCVICAASIPLLRPLFHHRKAQHQPPQVRNQWDNATLNSVFSKKMVRTRVSMSSEDNIIPPPQEYPLQNRGHPASITVTRSVEVTYQPSDVPFVHAALVGLIQGEIANPSLVKR